MGSVVQNVLGTVGIGKTQAQESMESAKAQQEAILNRLDQIGLPDIEKQKIALVLREAPAEYVPYISQYVGQLEKSAFSDISVPQELKDAQAKALEKITQRTDMGLTPEEKAEFEDLTRQARGQSQAQQASILQNLAQRGVAGSGQEIALRQMAQQNQTNQLADDARKIAAASFAAKQQALQNLGNMATQQRAQTYAEQSDAARANDIISQFNTQQRASSEANKQALLNQAQQYNLGQSEQYKADKANQANQQNMYNANLYQQQFQNQLQKAGAQNAAQGNLSNFYAQQGAAQQQQFNNLLGGAATLGTFGAMGGFGGGASNAGSAASAVGSVFGSDKDIKKNIQMDDKEIEKILDNLHAYKFEYKPGPFNDHAKHIGVMAQDLEKHPLSSPAVRDTPDGKVVETSQATPISLAGIANLNKRLKKIEKLLGGE